MWTQEGGVGGWEGRELTVHGSRFAVHSSRFTVHDSQFTVHGSRFALRERDEGGREGGRERERERGTQIQGREGGEGELGAREI